MNSFAWDDAISQMRLYTISAACQKTELLFARQKATDAWMMERISFISE
jgi:hypothetical protein